MMPRVVWTSRTCLPVFNFDVPFNAEDYVHRIGRTGRGRLGPGVTLVSGSDARLVATLKSSSRRRSSWKLSEETMTAPRNVSTTAAARRRERIRTTRAAQGSATAARREPREP